VWEGILTIAEVTAGIALVLRSVLHAPHLIELTRRLRSAPAAPVGPPIETLAADLRRLRRATESMGPGTSHARRVVTPAAYDDVLVQACQALALPDTLSAVRPGPDRDVERIRVEAMLEQEGLRFTRDR
jgi:hypothetical protein